ncbi:class F sortase [Saccharopolyspora subtropica]|uniref:Class F sortase n=1 Tax=Saccharopolyspora thermophila TaxID=89367 RepID=A0A917NCP9_9PSEU|nr:class F sortase [Saccharopolyspora subtropica]GGI87598.1 class F sortase [Saccharopolyspora subtropica]
MKAAALAVWFTLLLIMTCPPDLGPAEPVAASPVHPAATPAEPVVLPGGEAARPLGIAIPTIRVTSSLMPLGLNPDGSAEVPPIERPEQAGWFRLGPGAGEVGPFVVTGHVDSHTEAGVFYRLRDLRPGDRVYVERQDRIRVTYVVDRVTVVPKDRFPTDAVYGDVPRPEIRLITCGGAFDRTRGSYTDNVVVYGHLLQVAYP